MIVFISDVDAALSVGQQIGLSAEEIKSRLLPEEKLSFIKHLAEGRKKNTILSNPFVKSKLVMMCGDGLNDAPALASSDVGVAMGTGAALSMETADVTLLDSNLEKVEFSIRLGRRVTAKIIQNVIFSLLVKIIVLAFAIEGKAQLWAAIASDVGAMLVVTLNSMMLLPRRNHRFSSGPMQVDVEDGQGAQGAQQVSGPDGFANTQSSKGSGTSCCGLGNAPRNTHQAGSCAKGCCSKSGIEDKKSGHETVQTECKKGCCGTGSAKSKPVCVNQNKLNKTDVKITCQEGCCGENKKTVDGPQSGDSTPCTAEQRNLATEIVIKPCQKECCGANKESCGTGSGESCCSGDKKIESESLKNTSCEKQCCGGSNKPDASLGTGHDKSKPTDTEDKKFDSFITEKTCQKRCCESSERADATRGVEAGESKLPDTDGIYLDSANTGKASSKGCCGQSKGNGIECDKHDSDKARKTCTGTAGCCGSSEKLDESSC